jgi:hypothetical protein
VIDLYGLPTGTLASRRRFGLLTCAKVSARPFAESRFGRANVLVRWLSRGNGT